MSASKSSVISVGFGSWGSAPLVITNGFGQGSAPLPPSIPTLASSPIIIPMLTMLQ